MNPSEFELEAKQIGRQVLDRWLYRDLNLAIRPGDCVGISGKSGSGKSTLLRLLSLLDLPQKGELLWCGEPVAESEVPAFRSQVIYLPQRPVFNSGSVRENLESVFRWKIHHSVCFQQEWVTSQLDAFGFSAAILEQPASRLSGGEAGMIALLRALQLDPKILLLDEPTSAMDHGTAKGLESVVNQWINKKKTSRAVVWVSHDRGQLQRVANQEWEVKDAKLISIEGGSDGVS